MLFMREKYLSDFPFPQHLIFLPLFFLLFLEKQENADLKAIRNAHDEKKSDLIWSS